MSEQGVKQLCGEITYLNDKIIDMSGTDLLVIFYPAKWGHDVVDRLTSYFKERLITTGLDNRIFIVPDNVRVEAVKESDEAVSALREYEVTTGECSE